MPGGPLDGQKARCASVNQGTGIPNNMDERIELNMTWPGSAGSNLTGGGIRIEQLAGFPIHFI
jgi:hypothetical protein